MMRLREKQYRLTCAHAMMRNKSEEKVKKFQHEKVDSNDSILRYPVLLTLLKRN